MLDYLAIAVPIIILLIVYFVRLEARLAKITTDICWIKEYIEANGCPPNSTKA